MKNLFLLFFFLFVFFIFVCVCDSTFFFLPFSKKKRGVVNGLVLLERFGWEDGDEDDHDHDTQKSFSFFSFFLRY
jgi:hypothetical protein